MNDNYIFKKDLSVSHVTHIACPTSHKAYVEMGHLEGKVTPVDMFEAQAEETMAESRPLAERMRPRSLKDFIGQEEAVGKGTLLIDPSWSVGNQTCGAKRNARSLKSRPTAIKRNAYSHH